MRERRTRAVARERTGSESAQAPADGPRDAARPPPAPPHPYSGFAPNVTARSGVGTGRPGVGSGTVEKPGIPNNVVTRLGADGPARSISLRRSGPPQRSLRRGPLRRMGVERHRPVRAQSRRSGGPTAAFGRFRLLLRVPWQLRARSTRRGRAWLCGVPMRAGNGAERCFLHGVTRCFLT